MVSNSPITTVVIAGGNSGVGASVAEQLASDGTRVIILGQDPDKGAAVLAKLLRQSPHSEFVPCDLSTANGVREAASAILSLTDRIDTLAINYPSRYRLTQSLLPKLSRAPKPRVLMMMAGVHSTDADLTRMPDFAPFCFWKNRVRVQLADHHYAQHFAH